MGAVTLVLRLSPETQGAEWTFVRDVAPLAWRRQLQVGDKLEVNAGHTPGGKKTTDVQACRWQRGTVTKISTDGNALTIQYSDKGSALHTVATHRLEGTDLAPPLTFLQPEHQELDDHHSLCTNCGLGGDLLLCDEPGCPYVYHMHCLTPALKEVPEGDWFCPHH